MPARRVIAHFMHESEQAAAVARMRVEASTESYVIGTADEAELLELGRRGLIIQELPTPPAPAAKMSGAIYGAARMRAMNRATETITPDDETPDLTRPQYF